MLYRQDRGQLLVTLLDHAGDEPITTATAGPRAVVPDGLGHLTLSYA